MHGKSRIFDPVCFAIKIISHGWKRSVNGGKQLLKYRLSHDLEWDYDNCSFLIMFTRYFMILYEHKNARRLKDFDIKGRVRSKLLTD